MNPWAFGCLPSAGRRFRRPVVSVRGRRCADILKNEKKRKYYFSALGLSADFAPRFPTFPPRFPRFTGTKNPPPFRETGHPGAGEGGYSFNPSAVGSILSVLESLELG